MRDLLLLAEDYDFTGCRVQMVSSERCDLESFVMYKHNPIVTRGK